MREAAQFDLVVDTAHVFNIALGTTAHEVAGVIHAAASHEWVVDERLRG